MFETSATALCGTTGKTSQSNNVNDHKRPVLIKQETIQNKKIEQINKESNQSKSNQSNTNTKKNERKASG